MKVAAIGSRTFNNYGLLHQVLSYYPVHTLISGGSRGADQLAEKYADTYNIPKMIYKPNWEKYGKKAAIMRNNHIIGQADIVIAFWDGQSKGTEYVIKKCQKIGKDLVIIKF